MSLLHRLSDIRARRGLWAILMGLCAPTALAMMSLFAGCGDDSTEAPTPRRGGSGATCQKTDDCKSPLSCIGNVCVGEPEEDAGSDADAMVVGDGPSADAGPWGACDECLDTECNSELEACGEACVGIEACIETQCTSLGLPESEESKCFVDCQSKNPGGKASHLAVVNCANKGTCMPPCVPYPQDYEACRAFMNNGDCAGPLAACKASVDCQKYGDCASQCTTLSECLACDDTLEAQTGRQLFEAHARCVAAECLTESWLPEF